MSAAMLLVANAVIQVIAFPLLAYFYAHILPGWLGFDQQHPRVDFWAIARSVALFLGVPLAAGFLSQWLGRVRRLGSDMRGATVARGERSQVRKAFDEGFTSAASEHGAEVCWYCHGSGYYPAARFRVAAG